MYNTELKEVGLKVTLPKLRVLEVLKQDTSQYITAEDVYKTLLEQGRGMRLTIIYRVLAQFEEVGLVQRLHFEDKPARYTLATENVRNHLVCTTSDKVEGFTDTTIEEYIKEVAKDKGFKVDKYSLTVYGTFEE